MEATLFAKIGAAAFEITIRPDAGVVSATNPNFYGNVLLESFPLLDKGVGELSTVSLRFVGAGTMTRATS